MSPTDSLNRDQKGSTVGVAQVQSSTTAVSGAADGSVVASDGEGRAGMVTPGKTARRVNRAGRGTGKTGGTPLKKGPAGGSLGSKGRRAYGGAEGDSEGRGDQAADDERGSHWGDEGDWELEPGFRGRRRRGGGLRRVLVMIGGMGAVAAAAAGATASVIQKQQRAASG